MVSNGVVPFLAWNYFKDFTIEYSIDIRHRMYTIAHSDD